MIIVSDAAPSNPLAPLWPALLLAIGAAAAAGIGIFRRGGVVGPDRIERGEPLEPLTVAMGAGLFTYFTCILLLMQRLGAGVKAATTVPATQPISRGEVTADLVARIVAMAVIGTMLLLWYRRPRRLGFAPANLPRGLGAGLLSLLVVLPLMWLVLAATELALKANDQYVHPYLQLLGDSHDPTGRALILFSILAAAPFSEELVFRACLQTFFVGVFAHINSWPAARTRWLAILLTSFLFAMAHPDWWSRPPIFVLSLCIGYAYERTGNLWTAITIHVSFNAVETLLFINS